MALPETVTTLNCPNGSTVHLVGTAHFSKESVQDVRTTVTTVQPQVTVARLGGGMGEWGIVEAIED